MLSSIANNENNNPVFVEIGRNAKRGGPDGKGLLKATGGKRISRGRARFVLGLAN